MEEVLERELKWDVDEHFALPRLDDVVAGRERGTEHGRTSTARTTTPPTATCSPTGCCCGGATATTTPAGS